MKKITLFFGLCTLAICLLSISEVKAQELRLGIHGGAAISDASNTASFNLGLDGAFYFWEINDALQIGAATGYTRFFGKNENVAGINVEHEDLGFIPVAASARGTFNSGLFYTADVGYAISLDEIVDGGLYYQGKFGWSSNDTIDLFLYYRGIVVDELDLNSVGLGVAFKVF